MAVPSEWPETLLPPLRPPPLLGEHSAEVLAEAGYSPQQIREMAESGATRVTTTQGTTAPIEVQA
jgi:crotonobetainyl-CoA:carnitine CoA-transferase CaiB-like acyl-CoA transferase